MDWEGITQIKQVQPNVLAVFRMLVIVVLQDMSSSEERASGGKSEPVITEGTNGLNVGTAAFRLFFSLV